jgi:hypothetical protein
MQQPGEHQKSEDDMFKQIRKQKGLEILEYGLIAALVIAGAAIGYTTMGGNAKNNAEAAAACLNNPADAKCKAPGTATTTTTTTTP